MMTRVIKIIIVICFLLAVMVGVKNILIDPQRHARDKLVIMLEEQTIEIDRITYSILDMCINGTHDCKGTDEDLLELHKELKEKYGWGE